VYQGWITITRPLAIQHPGHWPFSLMCLYHLLWSVVNGVDFTSTHITQGQHT